MRVLRIAFTILLLLSVLSLTSLPLAVSASTVQPGYRGNMSPLTTYKLYDLTMSPSPKTVTIKQSSGSDCQGFPVCGNGTIQFTMDNKGNVTFTTDGSCLMVVTPSPTTGSGSENLNCYGIPLFHLPSGDEAILTWTQSIYNWPNGKYTFTFNVDGTAGTSRFVYQSKNVTFTAKVTGGP